MKVEFAAAPEGTAAGIVARIVDQDALPAGLEPVVAQGARATRFAGKAGQLFEIFVERDGQAVRLALAGAGEKSAAARLANLEKAGAGLVARFLTSGETVLTIDLTDPALSSAEVVAVLSGARLRGWRHDVYRTRLTDEQKPSLGTIRVVGAPAGTAEAWAVETALAEGVEFTRQLVTEPANIIYPESFVARCRDRFAGTGLELIVLDESEMKALGMGALLGVAQGSARPPRLLAMKWNGGAVGEPPVAFVGKGVTFDTGGISIKPAAGMEDMKGDMGGAAAVIGLMHTLAARKAKANVVGILGLVENMPDGNAQRPGDIVRSMSGQTIEVINTDAEGRLVLCDALWYCNEMFKPQFMVNLATLTGAIMVALGSHHAGLFSNDDTLAARLTAAGLSTNERLWRMPLGREYDKMIDSKFADMKNTGGRYAGSITAAQFLQRFVKDTPWAHLDIAGTAMGSPTDEINQSWASGFGVRLLDELVRANYEG